MRRYGCVLTSELPLLYIKEPSEANIRRVAEAGFDVTYMVRDEYKDIAEQVMGEME